MQAALDAAGEASGQPGHGRGMAIFGRQIGGGAAGAVVTAEADGTFTVLSPTVDVGTGTHTIEQQMVANEFGVGLDRVRVRPGDTDTTPFDEGPRASRVTYTEGTAVLRACEKIKDALADGASLPLTITYEHVAEQPEDYMYFSCQIADVVVDAETGQVKVERVITAHDVGTVINPLGHQGQINGGFITGYGLAMTEELVEENGRIINSHLGDYKLPNIQDLPELQTVLVPSEGGLGPVLREGDRGAGEQRDGCRDRQRRRGRGGRAGVRAAGDGGAGLRGVAEVTICRAGPGSLIVGA